MSGRPQFGNDSEPFDADYESGYTLGLTDGNTIALREAEKGHARLAAYRAAVRECLAEIRDIEKSLPPDVRAALAGIDALLTRLAIAEVTA